MARAKTKKKAKSAATAPAEDRLVGISACVFDAYGTLFDFGSAAEAFHRTLGKKTEILTEIWRRKQLEYSWLRGLMGKHVDFWQVTRDALDYAFESLNLDDEDLKSGLLDVYARLDAFPDVKEVLLALKKADYQIAILSNGSPMMLRAAVGSAGLASSIDMIISVEEVGVYKPHPSVYSRVLTRLSVQPEEVVYLSSNGWDAHAASAFGFKSVWVNRTRTPADRLPEPPSLIVESLADLPRVLGAVE